MTMRSPAVVGVGYAVPAHVRKNDDPVFDWIKANQPSYLDNFKGFDERRILGPDETLAAIMKEAAQAALADAGVLAQDVDLLLGLGSVGDFVSPNTLVQTHHDLQLGPHCRIVPLASEFTVFDDALVFADALLRADREVRNVLVICGCNWSRHVSYHEATCIGAADGAGAAVIALSADATKFRVMDTVTRTDTSFFGAMRMAARTAGTLIPSPPYAATFFTTPLMYFGTEAEKAFQEFGGKVPPELVQSLLAHHGVSATDVCLITHQASSVLTDAWLAAIAPGQFLTTMPEYANMTLASVPVTLAKRLSEIEKDYLVILTIGMQQQASALLLRRQTRPDNPNGANGPS